MQGQSDRLVHGARVGDGVKGLMRKHICQRHTELPWLKVYEFTTSVVLGGVKTSTSVGRKCEIAADVGARNGVSLLGRWWCGNFNFVSWLVYQSGSKLKMDRMLAASCLLSIFN